MNKPRAIVLGGTNPHIELINILKARGYYTILVDYLENSPAKQYADQHVQESTLDLEKVLEIARDIQVDLVISASIDQANLTACYVGEKLGLPIPYSYQTALEVTDKGLMKAKMIQAGIPTSKFITLEEEKDTNGTEDLKFPLMVKPADNCGSTGVRKVNNREEFGRYLNEAYQASRVGRAIAEEFVTGKEISVYAFVHSDNAEIIMMSERHSTTGGAKENVMCYATTTPPMISEEAKVNIQKASTEIAHAFGLDNTPLHVQVFVDGDDISVIEFAPRVGGGVSYKTIKMKTGFDIISATVESFLGNKVKPIYRDDGKYYSINIVYAKPGILGKITELEKLKEKGIIEHTFYYKPEESLITDDRTNSSRVCNFIVTGESYKEVVHKVDYAFSKIDVKDGSTGDSILIPDMFIKN